MKLQHSLVAGALGLTAVVALANPAGAHVYPDVTEAAAGSFVLFNLVVPHGCEEAATTKIEVDIPEGIYSATAGVVPGWAITKTTETLDEPVDDGHGGQYTERDAVVTWEGGPLAPDQLVEFPLSVQVPDTPGETILFPVIQTCEGGASTEWIQPTVEGEEEPEHPAPAITLTEATGGHGSEEPTEEENPDDTEEAASTSDDDDSDSNGLAIAGLVAGLIGIGLGGVALTRSGRSLDRGMIDGMTLAMRILRVVAVALGLVVVGAAPAAADAAGPSDFRSEVTGIVPALEGVEAEIRGGDSFLEVTVDEGTTVIVEGYQGEPYLRFNPDGTVERNRLSTATYLNDDRDGSVTIPPDVAAADPDDEPDWEAIADGGTYAWHDHRVHWMSEASPPVDRGEAVGGEYDPWRVPIVVDGSPTEIQGTLVYEETVTPLPYLGVAVIVAGLLGFYGRKPGLRLAAGLLAVVSLAAVVVGWAAYASTPDGGGNPLQWVLAAVALVTAIGGVLLARRAAGVVLTLASVAALFGWALFRIEVLFKPVLPTELPDALDRTVVALALGVSIGAAIVALLGSGLSLPSLADDEGPTTSRSS